MYNVGFPGGYTCPTYGSRDAEAIMDFNRSRGYGSAVSYTHVSGGGGASAYGPLVNCLYAARRKAIARMAEQCQALGGHGVVGVSLSLRRFPAGGVEFNVIGTAVRAPGGVRLSAPFTSAVSGQEFAKLIMAGLVPVSLVLGISIGVRHDDWLMRGQTRLMVGNVEVAAYTELVNRTRQDARNELLLDVGRVSADGVVIQRTEMHIGEAECRGKERAHDYRAEVTMLGTAISHFGRMRAHRERPSLAVLSLDPERRSTVRAGAGTMGSGPSLSVLLGERHDSQEATRNGEQEQQ